MRALSVAFVLLVALAPTLPAAEAPALESAPGVRVVFEDGWDRPWRAEVSTSEPHAHHEAPSKHEAGTHHGGDESGHEHGAHEHGTYSAQEHGMHEHAGHEHGTHAHHGAAP